MPFLLLGTTLSSLVASYLHVVLLFSSSFSNFKVKFVRQQANEVVYALAKETTLLASLVIYYDIPKCIETLIINEML